MRDNRRRRYLAKANQRAMATDTACMSITSMFLAKIAADPEILEHRRRVDAAIASWRDCTYRLPSGQKIVCLGGYEPPEGSEKILD